MPSQKAEDTIIQSSEAGTGSFSDLPPALASAAQRFQFDPRDSTTRQRGVEDLQRWLMENGAEIRADGILGPQTAKQLERISAEIASPAVSERPAEPSSDGQRVDADTELEDEPGTTPEPGDEDYDPDRHGEEQDRDAATARPVALSDSAVEELSQDRLGFRPYVEAVAEFILAEQTRPPLAIAINARWGQGKTSFMNMLDGELKDKAPQTTMRVATTWFNPWKYSEAEQVWAAFVANVTRCLRDNLTREQSWRFQWGRFRQKWHRHADLAFVLRLLVALAFVILVFGVLFTMQWSEFETWSSQGNSFLAASYKAVSVSITTGWWYLLAGPFALLALIYGYVTFTKSLGLNLLEYVEKTDFKDKIGTLSQFENEMQRLAKAVPEDLKVVVFIDDLDRCKGRVLGEIIEALQLAEVSQTCIFVMGMDMHIVANAIESERGELAQSAGSAAQMEHSIGYKFLEKIIQARLTLPAHGRGEMESLVADAMARPETADRARPDGPAGAAAAEGIRGASATDQGDRKLKGRGSALGQERETPSDSEAVIATAKFYGSRHFSNPRRLKRFINGFRLQAYLAGARISIFQIVAMRFRKVNPNIK